MISASPAALYPYFQFTQPVQSTSPGYPQAGQSYSMQVPQIMQYPAPATLSSLPQQYGGGMISIPTAVPPTVQQVWHLHCQQVGLVLQRNNIIRFNLSIHYRLGVQSLNSLLFNVMYLNLYWQLVFITQYLLVKSCHAVWSNMPMEQNLLFCS